MVTAVVMVGEATSENQPVAWVQGARRQATRDLLAQLGRQPLVDRIILLSPEVDDLATPVVSDVVLTPPGPLHVGRQLAGLIQQFGLRRLLCLGGGSAPLLEDETLAELLDRLAAADRLVISNNRFASDWAGVTPATAVSDWAERLPQDNMLGWVLSAEAGLPAASLPASAATRLDIDTPTDLLALRMHPRAKEHLRAYLRRLPLDTTVMEQALAALARPAGRILIAGRFAPDAWLALNRASQCWLRVISEERGMVSSGRLARGEVYSLLADHIAGAGLAHFFSQLAAQADAAFLDTRLLLAHHGRWPPETDRFASDLGLVAPIEDNWLREFTRQASQAPLPVILGGHGLMAGVMFAFCEML